MADTQQQQKEGHDLSFPMSLREIARQENISHQAVSEILARALLKLKKALDKKGIKIEDLL